MNCIKKKILYDSIRKFVNNYKYKKNNFINCGCSYLHSFKIICTLWSKIKNIMFKTKLLKDIVLLDFGNSKIFKNSS